MKDKNETHVYFGVFDFGDDPSVVTEIMGIKPSSSWVKGEPVSNRPKAPKRNHSRWVLESDLDGRQTIENNLEALLSIPEPLKEKNEAVKERFYVRIGICQYIYEVNPQFYLTEKVLEKLGNLGVQIYFDQYCLNEDEDC